MFPPPLKTGAPNEISWQISAPHPAYSWLARETEQIQNPGWQAEKYKKSMNLASWHLKALYLARSYLMF